MKKFIIFLLAFTMLLGVTACGTQKQVDNGETKEGYATFYDFEINRRDFNEIRIRDGYFGDISYNFDT